MAFLCLFEVGLCPASSLIRLVLVTRNTVAAMDVSGPGDDDYGDCWSGPFLEVVGDVDVLRSSMSAKVHSRHEAPRSSVGIIMTCTSGARHFRGRLSTSGRGETSAVCKEGQ